jgi:hypothetical protein
MSSTVETSSGMYADRRKSYPDYSPLGRDRRQFGANYDDLTAPGRDIAIAIDRYKVDHHRRFINADELLSIILSAGYRRADSDGQPMDTDGEFVERRGRPNENPVGVERRQFTGNYNELSPEGRDLALGIDQYKLVHRRRIVSPDELVELLHTMGYARR